LIPEHVSNPLPVHRCWVISLLDLFHQVLNFLTQSLTLPANLCIAPRLSFRSVNSIIASQLVEIVLCHLWRLGPCAQPHHACHPVVNEVLQELVQRMIGVAQAQNLHGGAALENYTRQQTADVGFPVTQTKIIV
jgi:hypothetical protein